MATSVLRTFLTSTLPAGPAALGVIEGVSDAPTGLSKLAGGPLGERPARRGRLASGGCLGTAIATSAIGPPADINPCSPSDVARDVARNFEPRALTATVTPAVRSRGERSGWSGRVAAVRPVAITSITTPQGV